MKRSLLERTIYLLLSCAVVTVIALRRRMLLSAFSIGFQSLEAGQAR